MDSAKVSVIIPVYNAEKYLGQCLDSVINQTLKEIEIICVNDGSTDNSPQILEEYSKKDKRIKIVNKKHVGPGLARNIGMEHATGEYIGFVDSDDWVDVSMFEKLYENAKIHDSEIVMCPCHRFDDKTKELYYDKSYFTLECFDKRFDDCTFDYSKTKEFLFDIPVTVWNKIYKTEFLNKINAKFDGVKIGGDNPFFFEIYLKASKISLIRDYLYFYRINRSNSIVMKGDKTFFDFIKTMDLVKKIFFDMGIFDDHKIDLLNFIIGTLVYKFSQINECYNEEFFELIKQYFEELDLSNEEIAKLNGYARDNYHNFMNSGSSKELELLNEIAQLKADNSNLLNQNQIYENKVREFTEDREVLLDQLDKTRNELDEYVIISAKLKEEKRVLQDQLDMKRKELAEYLTTIGYLKYKSKNITTRLENKLEGL